MNERETMGIIKEYEQLQKLREIWSRAIMTWGQVIIPLGASIIAFFLYLAINLDAPPLLFIGWLLFTFCMAYWRWIVHHIDKQIVHLYPRFISLERQLGWEIQTGYCYNNLTNSAQGFLRHELGLSSNPLDFEDFAQIAQHENHTQYGLLLAVIARFGRSAFMRGHVAQDRFVFGIIVVSLIGIVYYLCCGF